MITDQQFASLELRVKQLESIPAALQPDNSPYFDPIALDIVRIVCSEFHLSSKQLSSPRRVQPIAFARQVAMSLIREETEMTLEQIGVMFGNRDHGTVLHAIHTVRDCRDQKQLMQIARVRVRMEEEIKPNRQSISKNGGTNES